MLDPRPPYSPETLAERWQCHPRTIRRMIETGKLPAFKVGMRLLRIPAKVVDAYEINQTIPPEKDE